MDVVDIVYQIIQRRWRGLPVYRMADVHNVHNVHILNHQDGGLPATPPPINGYSQGQIRVTAAAATTAAALQGATNLDLCKQMRNHHWYENSSIK